MPEIPDEERAYIEESLIARIAELGAKLTAERQRADQWEQTATNLLARAERAEAQVKRCLQAKAHESYEAGLISKERLDDFCAALAASREEK